MNIKGLIRFGRGSCQKPRLVEILLRSKKHMYGYSPFFFNIDSHFVF
jgi:hypothetical protein